MAWKSAFWAKFPDISRPQFHLPPLGALASWHAWRRLVAKVGTSNQDRTISLKAVVRSLYKQTRWKSSFTQSPAFFAPRILFFWDQTKRTPICPRKDMKFLVTRTYFFTNTHTILVKVKVKVKSTLEHITKAHKGSWGIALLFLLPWL
jgi:hypothetical protein